MKNNLAHILIAFLFLGLLVLLTDPFMLFMPPMAAMAVLLCASVLLCVWSGFVLVEQFSDERELMHRMYAGRIAYLAGLITLTLALLFEGFLDHHIDSWVALALAAMVVSKLAARLYYDRFK